MPYETRNYDWMTPQAPPSARPRGGLFAPPQITGGLFGDAPEQRDARMALAAALLEGGGPSLQPTSGGQIFGRALMASRAARDAAIEAGQKKRYLDAQIKASEAAASQKAAPERVDLGDAWGILDNTGNVVTRIPKGTSPDATAAQRAAEAEREAQRVFQQRQQEDAQAFQAQQAELNRAATAENAEAARASSAGKSPAVTDAKTKLGQVRAARPSLANVQKSSDELSDWQTGPVAGRRMWLGGLSDAEQLFEADVAALSNQIVAATKIPGLGSQSDADAERLERLTPKLTDDKAARDRKIEGLKAWLDEIEATNRDLAGQAAAESKKGPASRSRPPLSSYET